MGNCSFTDNLSTDPDMKVVLGEKFNAVMACWPNSLNVELNNIGDTCISWPLRVPVNSLTLIFAWKLSWFMVSYQYCCNTVAFFLLMLGCPFASITQEFSQWYQQCIISLFQTELCTVTSAAWKLPSSTWWTGHSKVCKICLLWEEFFPLQCTGQYFTNGLFEKKSTPPPWMGFWEFPREGGQRLWKSTQEGAGGELQAARLLLLSDFSIYQGRIVCFIRDYVGVLLNHIFAECLARNTRNFPTVGLFIKVLS